MLDVKLETLLAVSNARSFTKAAAELGLTQPAVSHHITQLEKDYGVKLFLRGKGEFRPTPEGKVVILYARRFKAMYDKMREELNDASKQMTRIRIGVTHTSESNTITEILAKYASEHENVSITIITDTIKNLYGMLESYEIDIAIVEGKRQGQNLNYLMLDTDYLVCVLNNENPLAAQSMVTIDELKGEHMILRLPSSATRQLFEASLLGINETIQDFNITIEVDNISTIKDLIRKGMGVSILPRSACMDELRKGKITVLPIENLSMMRETNIVYNRDFNHVELLKDIVKLYQDTMKIG